MLDRESAGMFLRTRSARVPRRDDVRPDRSHRRAAVRLARANIITINGERHARLRKLTHPFFTPAAADRYRPAMRELLDELFAPLAERAAAASSCPSSRAAYPSKVIATVVGAPLEDWDRLQRLSNLLQSQFDAIAVMTRREELEQAARGVRDVRRASWSAQRRGDPRDDLASALIAAESEGDRLSEEECVHLLLDTINGGIDTTQSQLAHGVRLFAAHPDQWRLLAEDPSLVPRAVEEILRFEPVAPFTTRVLLEDVEHRDIHLPGGHGRVRLRLERQPRGGWRRAPDRVRHHRRPRQRQAAHLRRRAALLHGRQPRARRAAGGSRVPLAAHARTSSSTARPCYGNITGLYGMRSLPVRWGLTAA